MSNKKIALIFAVLAGFFVFFNFNVEDAGTLFLILAVACGLLAGYFFNLDKKPKE